MIRKVKYKNEGYTFTVLYDDRFDQLFCQPIDVQYEKEKHLWIFPSHSSANIDSTQAQQKEIRKEGEA